MNSSLNKLAHDAIVSLREENSNLKEQLDIIKEATRLSFQMVKDGKMPIERAEDFIEKFASKSKEELEMTKKAYEMSTDEKFNSLFELSNADENIGLTPEERLIRSLLP
jgi:polyhydroxyalkanoate synthesis regulator phasin